MAVLSSDGKYVTVQSGDTLSEIAQKYAGGASKYKQLAAINNISNPDLIFIGQKIYLTSSGSSTTKTNVSSNAPTNVKLGVLSTDEGKLLATWDWGKQSQTESYKLAWEYTDIGGAVFTNLASNSVDEHYYAASRVATYDIPSGVTKVRFRVKAISKTYTKDNKETKHFEGDWSGWLTHKVSTPLDAPSASVNLELDGLKLTAKIEGLETLGTHVEFRLIKNDKDVVNTTGKIAISTHTKTVSYTWSKVDAASEYKVLYRVSKGSLYSDWSNPSSAKKTAPKPPSKISSCKAIDESTVQLKWDAVKGVKKYEIQHTTKKEYFDTSNEVQSTTFEPPPDASTVTYHITGIAAGNEYFFRLRAVIDDAGESPWTDIVSVVIGTTPAPPTTWSSANSAIIGESVKLYWLHNSEDGASLKHSMLTLIINDKQMPVTYIDHTDNEDGEPVFFELDTNYTQTTSIKWHVRTQGIRPNDWSSPSVLREVMIYEEPSVLLEVKGADGNILDSISGFPFYIRAEAGPKEQTPIGYHISIVANESYEDTDSTGNVKMVKEGDAVYSKYFDTNEYEILLEMSAGNVNLAQGVEYTISCMVTMDSGLNGSASTVLPVSWSETAFIPNASISVDEDTYVAYIQPYCEETTQHYYQVTYSGVVYTKTGTELDFVFGEPLARGATTTTGEQVYYGVDGNDNSVYYCITTTSKRIDNIRLSVYRREFDGSFTELATGLDNSITTTISDPHPALDYARYRIVATSTETGAVGFYDLPGYPVGGKAVIIQWDEAWTSYETTSEDALAQPPWAGSLLKLPYNVDVSDKTKPDVTFVQYSGRMHPVSYYGTQVGQTSSWNVEIPKDDRETLYALRRLSVWMGDVYVREPSGSGYWANVNVSFGQTHCAVTIPVSFEITRVEGGI